MDDNMNEVVNLELHLLSQVEMIELFGGLYREFRSMRAELEVLKLAGPHPKGLDKPLALTLRMMASTNGMEPARRHPQPFRQGAGWLISGS